jgi:hypothetical protein
LATDSLHPPGPPANGSPLAWARRGGRAGGQRSDTAADGDACAGCGETDRSKLNHRVPVAAWLAGPDRAARAMVLCDACHADYERARARPLGLRWVALWILIGLLLLAFFELV